MSWADLHIVGDLLVARLLWLAVAELAFKPLFRLAGRRGWHTLDRLLGDRLPDLK